MFQRNSAIILSPFAILMSLIETMFKVVIRFMAGVIGLAIMFAGVVLCVTIIGALLGVPLLILGFIVVVKGLSV